MKINYPLIILIVCPLLFVLIVALSQTIYWYGSKEGTATLESIVVSESAQLKPSDVRRVTVTEIELSFTDNKGRTYRIKQLSPLTKYFFDYGDMLTVRYFNHEEFEGTI